MKSIFIPRRHYIFSWTPEGTYGWCCRTRWQRTWGFFGFACRTCGWFAFACTPAKQERWRRWIFPFEYSPSIAPDLLEHGLDRPDDDGPAPSHAGVVDPPEAPADQAHADFDDEMTLYELAQRRPGVPAAPVCPMEAPSDGVEDGAVEDGAPAAPAARPEPREPRVIAGRRDEIIGWKDVYCNHCRDLCGQYKLDPCPGGRDEPTWDIRVHDHSGCWPEKGPLKKRRLQGLATAEFPKQWITQNRTCCDVGKWARGKKKRSCSLSCHDHVSLGSLMRMSGGSIRISQHIAWFQFVLHFHQVGHLGSLSALPLGFWGWTQSVRLSSCPLGKKRLHNTTMAPEGFETREQQSVNALSCFFGPTCGPLFHWFQVVWWPGKPSCYGWDANCQ